MHWMMAMFLTKCLNSMCCATFVSRPLNLQNLKTLLLRRLVYGVAQVCAGSLALPEDLSGAKKKRGQHGRPMTGLSYRAMKAA